MQNGTQLDWRGVLSGDIPSHFIWEKRFQFILKEEGWLRARDPTWEFMISNSLILFFLRESPQKQEEVDYMHIYLDDT